MGRGGGRGPSKLRFRSLLECFAEHAGAISDTRRATSVTYPLVDCYRSAFAMFYLQDPSLLEFQRRFEDEVQTNNLASVFGVEEIPSDTQLRDIVDGHEYDKLREVFPAFIRRMQRSKELERYRFYQGKYLLTVDAAEYFNSEQVSCEHCLHRHRSSGAVEHYHQALQPAIVHPQLREVLPLAPEFIRQQDG